MAEPPQKKCYSGFDTKKTRRRFLTTIGKMAPDGCPIRLFFGPRELHRLPGRDATQHAAPEDPNGMETIQYI